MQTLFQDLRYGARMLLKKPGFTLIAAMTLALGMSASTAIFSVVNAVLLKPLPYPEPEQLVWVWGVQPQLPQATHSPADFLDYQAQNRSFEQMAAFRNLSFTLTGGDQSERPERIDGRIVSANYFSLLGIKAATGRTLASEDGKAGAARVAVLSHSFWQRRFHGTKDVIGATLTLNGESATVIGVMPPSFNEAEVNLWINPHQVVPDFATGSQADLITRRDNNYLRVIGRLKSGVSLQQAQADINTITARLQQQYPQTNATRSVRLVALHEWMTGDLRPTLLLLLGAVGLVLLIACANVANLMLVRAMARQKELAIRTALGASRWRLMRQLLTESLLLAGLGGLGGWMLAEWGVALLIALSPADVPRLSEISLDRQVFLFTLILSLLTGMLCGLIPALVTSRINPNEMLKDGGRNTASGASRHRLRGALVIAEMAFALVVLISAGLLIKSFARLQAVKPGFDPAHLTTMLVWLSEAKYLDPAVSRNFIKELNGRLEKLPGVEGVATTNDLPIRGTDSFTAPPLEGQPAITGGEQMLIGQHVVGPHYFQVMGIPLRAGREFTERDNESGPPVVIINETAARVLWPGANPLGRHLRTGGQNRWLEVVGVVSDVKHEGLHEESGMQCYLPHLRYPWSAFRLAVRSKLDPATVTLMVRREVQAMDPNQPISDVSTMDQIMAGSTAPRRLSMVLFSLFAIVSLLLTAVGLYGVMAYTVTQRTRELGIRLALGAQVGDVLKLVIRQGLKLTLCGVGLGMVTALALTRLMKSLLYGISATDPLTFALITLLLVGVALLACYIPARRATKVDPMVALRYE